MHVSDLRHTNPTLRDKLERLYALRTRSRVNWDAQGYRTLLHHMGDPHLRLPPVIHVAGTNGKGSIVAFLRAILEAQGRRVHTYTSPHLQRVNERIVLAGAEIEDTHLERLIDEAQAQHNLSGLSFFEITTAIAFKAFAETPADVLLLEVGMGGRLDCTNVIASPLVSIISRISRDHTEFLGEEIAQIALEKAGIIKPGRPCVLSAQADGADGDAVLRAVAETAGALSAPIYAFGRDWRSFSEGDGMAFEQGGERLHLPAPALYGAHQIANAGAAIMALRLVSEELPVSADSIVRGLRNVRWNGRLQRFEGRAFGLGEHTEVWLDSGHNDSAGVALAQVIRGWTEDDPKLVRLVLGMLAHKDVRGFLAPLAGLVDGIYLTPIQEEPQGLTPARLREAAGDLTGSCAVQAFGSLPEALDAATSDGPCRVLVAGSVYLAGDFLRLADERAEAGCRV